MTKATTSICPLCPLNCDDLVVRTNESPSADDCSIVQDFRFDEDRGLVEPTFLRADQRPFRVITTGVDLLAAREVVRLESLGRIELTVEADPSIEAMLQTISRDGIVSATLAEVATRADFVYLLGDVESTWPRISTVADFGRLNDGSVHRRSKVAAEELAEIFVESGVIGGGSKYAAILIGPEAFQPGEEAISSALVARFVRQRNQTSRCVCVTLDYATTLRSVSLWSHNQSPESKLDGRPDIRIGTPLNKRSEPATVQLGGQDLGIAYADSYIATSVAGIHHRSMLIRGDGAVSLPLAAVISSELPTVSEVLQRVINIKEHAI